MGSIRPRLGCKQAENTHVSIPGVQGRLTIIFGDYSHAARTPLPHTVRYFVGYKKNRPVYTSPHKTQQECVPRGLSKISPYFAARFIAFSTAQDHVMGFGAFFLGGGSESTPPTAPPDLDQVFRRRTHAIHCPSLLYCRTNFGLRATEAQQYHVHLWFGTVNDMDDSFCCWPACTQSRALNGSKPTKFHSNAVRDDKTCCT